MRVGLYPTHERRMQRILCSARWRALMRFARGVGRFSSFFIFSSRFLGLLLLFLLAFQASFGFFVCFARWLLFEICQTKKLLKSKNCSNSKFVENSKVVQI
jgi:hypothetical protein